MYIAATKLPPGKLAAQVAHAAIACYREACKRLDRFEVLSAWEHGDRNDSTKPSRQCKIVLRLENATSLIEHVQKADIPHAIIHDAGRTVVEPGTLTAIAVGPVWRDETGPWQSMKLY